MDKHTNVRSQRIGSTGLMVLLASSLLASCAGDDVDEIAGPVGELVAAPPGGSTSVAFEEFQDDVGDRAAREVRVLIRTRQGYRDYFGHAPPATVDFPRENVIFYAAGVKPTGGYSAGLVSLTRSGHDLLGVTRLVSPGAGCIVTQALTSPHVLVKFAAQPGTKISFRRADQTRDCEDGVPSACAAILCPVGSQCVEKQVQCVRAPCPPVAECVPIACGGIAGRPCPTGSTCVDNPDDGCDPNNGGADCGGICVLPPAGAFCGGIAGIPCPAGQTCIDNPNDDCDPNNGGADCGGVCVTGR
jgi:hypothetical protein